MKNIPKSVKARLRNLSKVTGRSAQEIDQHYVMERFLFRLSQSEYTDQFILKGGFLQFVWFGNNARTTKDIDVIGLHALSPDKLKDVLFNIFDADVEEDGVIFDRESISISPIREELHYGGWRAEFICRIENSRYKLIFDVGFGDRLFPEPSEIQIKTLLEDFPAPAMKCYKKETVIAEKFHAMCIRGIENSRMKDFLDIWNLLNQDTFSAITVSEAIRTTFEGRDTKIPEPYITAFYGKFVETWSGQWKRYIKKIRSNAPYLSELLPLLESFFVPVVLYLRGEGDNPGLWSPEGYWLEIDQ